MNRVVSFALSRRGLGHVSRLIAVHAALREMSWDSLFFVERQQRLISDYGFRQVVVPHDEHSLVGEQRSCDQNSSSPVSSLADLIAENCLTIHDTVLHDVVTYRPLYEWARRHARPQAFIYRDRKDRPDQLAWLATWAPAIDRVFLLGRLGHTTTHHGVTVEGVSDVIRQPLGAKSVWTGTTDSLRVAISAAGGGHRDAESFVDIALRGVAEFAGNTALKTSAFVVLGPNFAGRVSVPATTGINITMTAYLDPWHSLYQDTDLLVCQGGYNTVQELLHHRTPAVAVVGHRPHDDQQARLNSIADRTNLRIARPDPASIATQLSALLAAKRVVEAPGDPPDGAREIARRLAGRA